jgi:hypothetical protein
VTVKTNLAAERIRLVFVADEISPELRSILEFLIQLSRLAKLGVRKPSEPSADELAPNRSPMRPSAPRSL